MLRVAEAGREVDTQQVIGRGRRVGTRSPRREVRALVERAGQVQPEETDVRVDIDLGMYGRVGGQQMRRNAVAVGGAQHHAIGRSRKLGHDRRAAIGIVRGERAVLAVRGPVVRHSVARPAGLWRLEVEHEREIRRVARLHRRDRDLRVGVDDAASTRKLVELVREADRAGLRVLTADLVGGAVGGGSALPGAGEHQVVRVVGLDDVGRCAGLHEMARVEVGLRERIRVVGEVRVAGRGVDAVAARSVDDRGERVEAGRRTLRASQTETETQLRGARVVRHVADRERRVSGQPTFVLELDEHRLE